MYSVVGADWLESAVTEAEEAAAGAVETLWASAKEMIETDNNIEMMKAGFIGVRVLTKVVEGKVPENPGRSLS